MSDGFKSGFVVLVGRPNSGKSTLVNRLVGQKVSITSHQPQTTRGPVRGVLNGEGYQAIFVDTPGSQKPSDTLRSRMQQSVLDSLSEADVVVFMMDASQSTGEVGRGDRYVASLVAGSGTPAIAVINKADLLSGEAAELPIVKEVLSLAGWEEVLLLSATEGLNVESLTEAVVALLPEGPEYFPDGVATDYPESGILAEYIREKALGVLREEVPHAVAVEVEDVEREGNITTVAATIYVERPTQRMIVVGKDGETIKRIGTEARQEAERLLGERIYLDLRVKVRPGWRKDEKFLERMGL